jgi:hypothetical protein
MLADFKPVAKYVHVPLIAGVEEYKIKIFVSLLKMLSSRKASGPDIYTVLPAV